MAGPVLVLAQVRGGHAGDAAGVQAYGAGVGVDLGGRFAQAPAVGFAPGGAGAQPVWRANSAAISRGPRSRALIFSRKARFSAGRVIRTMGIVPPLAEASAHFAGLARRPVAGSRITVVT